MELREPPDPLGEKLLPVVSYAVQRRIAAGKPDSRKIAEGAVRRSTPA